MDVKDFFDRLERFCANKPEKISKDVTKCHVCEIRDFCYSPPACFKDNCNLSEVINFIDNF